MNRIIKFRVIINDKFKYLTIFDVSNNILETNIETLGEYTNIDDINGIEIFEGDIIEYVQHYFNMTETMIKRKVVKWDKLKGAWNIYETNAGESNLNVIGNIHQNSELI